MKIAISFKNSPPGRMTLLIALICLFGTSGTCFGQVGISLPAENAEVEQTTVVSGYATIQSDQHLWILVSPRGYGDLWLPVGEARIDSPTRLWSFRLTLGEPKDRGEFRIAVVVVDSDVHFQLRKHLQQPAAEKDSISQPIKMPRVMAPPLFRRVVRR